MGPIARLKFKSWVVLLLGLSFAYGNSLLLRAAPLLPPQTPPPAATLRLRYNANLRTQPSLSSKVTTILFEGSQVEMLAQTGEWLYVAAPEGVRGWINQLTIESAPPIAPHKKPYWVTYAAEVKLEPQANAATLGKIFPFQPLALLRQQESWQQIQEDHWIGWIKVEQASAASSEEQFQYGIVQTIKGGNIRQYPHLEAAIIGKVAAGEPLQVIGSWNDWYHILWNQGSGYVNSVLLAPESLKPKSYQFFSVNKDGNLRLRPALTAPVTGTVQAGQTGYLLRQITPWNLVYFPYSTIGWLHDLLITVTDRPPVGQLSPLTQQLSTLLQQATQARQQKAFAEAIRYYFEAQQALVPLENQSDIPDCLLLRQALIQYALSDHLYYPYNQADNLVVTRLQTIAGTADCYDDIQRALQIWQQGFEFRNQLLGIFSSKNFPIEQLIKALERNPTMLPLLLEAETRRYIGRYYAQYQQKKELALTWQKESVLLYRLLAEHGLVTSLTQLSNYFEVLLELAQNYYDLGKLHPSMAVLDDVYQLLQKHYREDWNKRYLKLVELVTSNPPR